MRNLKLITLKNNSNIVYNRDTNEYYVFSYESHIATVHEGKITELGNDWDYSTTTSRHLNGSLRHIGRNENGFSANSLRDIADMTKAQKIKYFEKEGLI